MARVKSTIPLLTMLAVSLSACNSAESTTELQRWNGSVSELRFSWDSENGINLDSGPAVPVRAYIESYMLAQYGGNLDLAYPGFIEAVPPNAPSDSTKADERRRRPNTNHPLEHPLVGTDRYHILSVENDEKSVIVTLCNYSYAVATEKSSGVFTSVGQGGYADTGGIYAMRISLTAPAEKADSLPSQVGPLPAPAEDVFNGWKISSFSGPLLAGNAGFNAVWPTNQADYASCVAKAPDSPERRAFFTNGEHARSDFPTSVPTPGWPEPAN
ncbi:hypothetical protein [Mycolicibacterium fortuitum]|uniref:hypothetical protein n=1 Tax=Mycolicibacterium fortuitum TaxID=1766 RepID=UPI000B19D623|nr:hypothetical protein [Mycolicibacterium fortuitum]MCA4723832.1 hypothetical protein [Mycolicibacterium fortuitum]